MPKLSEIPQQETPHADTDLLIVETASGTRTNTRAALLANSRTETTITTETLGNGEIGNVTLSVPLTVEILAVSSSAAARVRLYSTSATRAEDATRLITTRPTAGTGLILETVHAAAGQITLDPHAHGANMEAQPIPELYAAITNAGDAGTITVTFTYIERERT